MTLVLITDLSYELIPAQKHEATPISCPSKSIHPHISPDVSPTSPREAERNPEPVAPRCFQNYILGHSQDETE